MSLEQCCNTVFIQAHPHRQSNVLNNLIVDLIQLTPGRPEGFICHVRIGYGCFNVLSHAFVYSSVGKGNVSEMK